MDGGNMKPFAWSNRARILVMILGFTGASCMVQKKAVLLKDGELSHKQQAQTLTAKEPDAATKATLQAAYGKLPLSFEANWGQTDEEVHFLSRGSGYTLFLTSTEAVLALRQPSG